MITAVICGTVLLLSACNGEATPAKGTTAPATSGTTGSVTSTSAAANAPTTTRTDSGSAPETTRTDSGGDTPTTKTAAPAADGPWDPCGIPAADLAAAGLDSGTRERKDARGCQWLASDGKYELLINSLNETVDQLLKPGAYRDLRRTEYYGRQVVVFNSVQDSNHIGCLMGVQTSTGSVLFTTRKHNGQSPTLEPCAAVQEFAAKLGNKNLPA
ncbi:hypothetical protein ACFROC_05005 [Nocardia tengchongensis]|uniref:hypothetical protein n=1 Tax=Nocardia tengchongensis TaxID=2055889 RepID=UPI00367975BF